MADNTPVRVRIAPSPTGYLHVGTARSALFNFLYARHTGGKFLVRIEDTDAARSKAEFIEPIIEGLAWLGMSADDEIAYQSQRADLYKSYLERFLATDSAYHCFCTPERLEAERVKARAEKRNPHYNRKCLALSKEEVAQRLTAGESAVVRVKIPEGEINYNDLVSGELKRSSNDLEDFIVARSDGSVTYNFAVVVDDHDMKISHVIRGNDHITNTFKQVILYRALGLTEPIFAHIPLILRPDKKKVSKRLGDKDVGEYRDDGVLSSAMFNYLSLLGWSPKTDNEIYTPEQLVELFEIGNLNRSNAVFDIDKLMAFNKAHIQLMSDHDLAVQVAPLLVDAGLTSKYWLETRWEFLRQVIGLLKERVTKIPDFVTLGPYFFSPDFAYDPTAEAKHFTPESADILTAFADKLESQPEFTHDSLAEALSALAEEKGIKKAAIIHPTRLAVSGVPAGPSLYEMLAVMGKPVVLERLKKAINYIVAKSA